MVSGGVVKPNRIFGWGREAHPRVRRIQEAHLEVLYGSGGLPGGP